MSSSTGSKSRSGSKERDDKKKNKKSSKNEQVEQVATAESVPDEPPGPINQLTEVELASIFRFMPHFQLFRLMRVNKHWYKSLRSVELTSLDLRTFYGHFGDEHLASIASKYPDLTCVRIHAAPLLTDKSMKSLGKLPLVELDLSNCRNLTDASLIKIPQPAIQKLTSLTVSHCGFSERGLKLGVLPALTHLDISSCDSLAGARFAQHLVQYYPALSTLDCSNSPVIANDFISVLPKIQTLTALSIRNCPNIDHHGFLNFSDPVIANPPPQLLKLDISSSLINNEGLLRICTTYTTLTDLSISLCHRIDDDGCIQLPKLTSLKTFHASYTPITGETLSILKTMPSLKSIVVSGCRNLRKQLKKFIQNNPRLRVIAKTTTLTPPESN